MYRLHRCFSRHPKAFALSAGALACVLSLAGLGGVAVSAAAAFVANQHSAASGIIQTIGSEAAVLLEAANQGVTPDCSPESLLALNRLQLKAPTLTDIGTLDAQGRLICTTHAGVLKAAMPTPEADSVFILNGSPGSVTHNTPLLSTEGIASSIVTVGRFNAVVNPVKIDAINQTGIDGLWARRPDGSLALVTSRHSSNPAQIEAMTDEVGRMTSAADTFASDIDWSELQLTAVSTSPAGGYTTLSVKPLLAFPGAKLIAAIGLIASMAIGAVVYLVSRKFTRTDRSTERRLRKLLQPENMVCVYQPIVSLSSGVPVGFEVLTRLKDGDEIVFPDAFIPDVIRLGLTWQMDKAVVERACLDLIQHDIPVYGLRVAFNLFPENISSARLRPLFERHTEAIKRRGALVDLEIIEQNYRDSIIEDVRELREGGFLISVDDFGTGYSNLGAVKKLNPDYVKIDRSFVAGLQPQHGDPSLIPEIVGIARAVRARVVAEGIEHEHQATALQRMGVEYGQGYHFAKPMSPRDLLKYLTTPRSNVIALYPKSKTGQADPSVSTSISGVA